MRDEELGGLLLIGDNNARVVVDKIDNINLTIDKDVNASMTFSDVTTSHFYTVTVNSGATLGLGNTTVNSIRLNDGSTLKLSGELLINGTLHIIGEESANLIILNSDANIILNEEAYIVDRDSFLNIQIGDDNNKVNYRDNTLFSSIGEYVKNITINRGSTLSLGKDNIIENGGDFTVKGTLNLGTGTLDVNTFIVSDGAIVTLHIDKNEKYGKIIAGTYNISKNNTILKLFLDYVPSVGDEEIELNMFGGDVVFGSSPKNILYNFEYVGEGTYKMTRKKIGDVANEIGISENNQQTLSVWGDLVDTEVGHKLNLLLISDDIEVNRDELIRNLTLLAPDESPMVQSSAASTFNMVASAVGTRLSGGLGSPALGGLSSGDTFVGKNIWVQGLYNVSKLDNSFDSSTRGAALGLEGKFNNYFTAGIGYAYTDSDVDGERNTDIITNTFFLYGEYNDPLSFFVNGMISFGTSKYNEIKKINIGNLLAKYDANTLAFQAKIGYEVSNEIVNITRAISVRYISTNTKPYTDILKQEVSSNRATTLTGLINLKFDREFIVTKDFILRPEIIAGIGYDFVNEGGSSVVKLTDKYSYTIKEQTLKKTLYEVGVGINGNISRNLNLSINYDRQIRTDYVDNTFVVNIRYNF
jgi:outer membrane autotransporter protein